MNASPDPVRRRARAACPIPLRDQVFDAIREVLANKQATALSAIAIAIASFGMLIVFALTDSLGAAVEKMAFSGGTVLTVTSDPRPSMAALRLTDRDYAALEAGLEGVRRISRIETLGMIQIGAGTATASIPAIAASGNLFDTGQYLLLAGRLLLQSDSAHRRRIVVLDSAAAKRLGLATADLGRSLDVGGRYLELVGIVEPSALLGRAAQADGLAIVPDTLSSIFVRMPEPPITIQIELYPREDPDAWTASVNTLLRRSRNQSYVQAPGFAVHSSETTKAGMRKITGLLSLVATLLVGVSLVVGAVGITNVSLMSVRNRYFEIGVRKAIGANYRVIVRQFLLENTIVAILGAMVGTLAFVLVVEASNALFGDLFYLYRSPVAIGIALAVSALIGIFSGVAPAVRAANLDPAVTLRS